MAIVNENCSAAVCAQTLLPTTPVNIDTIGPTAVI